MGGSRSFTTGMKKKNRMRGTCGTLGGSRPRNKTSLGNDKGRNDRGEFAVTKLKVQPYLRSLFRKEPTPEHQEDSLPLLGEIHTNPLHTRCGGKWIKTDVKGVEAALKRSP